MAYPNIFDPATTETLFARLDALTPTSTPLWGKMNVGQMVAHCSVAYEVLYGEKKIGLPKLAGWVLKWFMKPGMTNEVPYKKSMPTGKVFVQPPTLALEAERERLKGWIRRVEQGGAAAIDGKAHEFLGPLTAQEWNNMLYKHLDHHLRQFGV